MESLRLGDNDARDCRDGRLRWCEGSGSVSVGGLRVDGELAASDGGGCRLVRELPAVDSVGEYKGGLSSRRPPTSPMVSVNDPSESRFVDDSLRTKIGRPRPVELMKGNDFDFGPVDVVNPEEELTEYPTRLATVVNARR